MFFQAKIGPKLKSLRYTNFTEFVDIDVVLLSCPNLETIGISAGLSPRRSQSELCDLLGFEPLTFFSNFVNLWHQTKSLLLVNWQFNGIKEFLVYYHQVPSKVNKRYNLLWDSKWVLSRPSGCQVRTSFEPVTFFFMQCLCNGLNNVKSNSKL